MPCLPCVFIFAKLHFCCNLLHRVLLIADILLWNKALPFFFQKSYTVSSSDHRECDLRWWYAETPSSSGRRLLQCGMKVLPLAVSTCCSLAASNLEFTRDRPGPLAFTPEPCCLRYLYSVQYPVEIWSYSWSFKKTKPAKVLWRICERNLHPRRVHYLCSIWEKFLASRKWEWKKHLFNPKWDILH